MTVGHGPEHRDPLGARLTAAGVELVVDVRRFPGSRNNPDVRREALAEWLPAVGIGYRWEERLGGRRSLPKGTPVVDDWWTVTQFAAYAAYTRTPEFAEGLHEVLREAEGRTVAVMCSESVWWRCHRRIVADVAVLAHRCDVVHLMPDGRLAPHRPSEAAVLLDGVLTWPRAVDQES
ncbi:DUF488 family protein [Blastococcus sp. LR1]|uniref:DUF488 domain-containing protein n=1 Tax=Blastococcus sp. LR1 TaxID=2877000 RepID=UPI001CCF7C9A|nr:DUF488 domain-containing protein [Blastococcus sp. LR1]MCA0144169.1 DUF488 domain-containing protein [Blastococcus sp. LR1]